MRCPRWKHCGNACPKDSSQISADLIGKGEDRADVSDAAMAQEHRRIGISSLDQVGDSVHKLARHDHLRSDCSIRLNTDNTQQTEKPRPRPISESTNKMRASKRPLRHLRFTSRLFYSTSVEHCPITRAWLVSGRSQDEISTHISTCSCGKAHMPVIYHCVDRLCSRSFSML